MKEYVQNTSLNLLGTTSRVEVPAIGIKIGEYVFGVYSFVDGDKTKYQINPKYVDGLTVRKINGTVNQYTLKLRYPVTEKDDPNYIEKIISTVSDSRKITFSYGDLSTPAFVYKEEEAIIIRVKRKSTISSSVKDYTIYAVSKGALNSVGAFKFRKRYDKPSNIIKELLNEPKYGLTQVFYGMRDKSMVAQRNLIRDDDAYVSIDAKTNISSLDYLSYLVDCMSPLTGANDDIGITKKCKH